METNEIQEQKLNEKEEFEQWAGEFVCRGTSEYKQMGQELIQLKKSVEAVTGIDGEVRWEELTPKDLYRLEYQVQRCIWIINWIMSLVIHRCDYDYVRRLESSQGCLSEFEKVFGIIIQARQKALERLDQAQQQQAVAG